MENKFNEVIEKGIKDSEIYERSIIYARTKLEEELHRAKGEYSSLSNKYENLKENKDIENREFEKMKQAVQEKSIKLQSIESDYKKIKQELKNRYIADELRKWRRPTYWAIMLIILISIFTLLQFTLKNSELNYVYKLIRYIDSLESDTLKGILRNLLYAPILALWTLACFCFHRLFSQEKKQKKIGELEETFNRNNQ